jgi:hypothetical protein
MRSDFSDHWKKKTDFTPRCRERTTVVWRYFVAVGNGNDNDARTRYQT